MYLLSNDIVVVIRLDLEGAVVGPEVDRGGDAGNASLIDLENRRSTMLTSLTPGEKCLSTHHLGSLGPGHGKLQVGILLPITKQQRELGQESIICASDCGDGLRTRVAVDSTFQVLRRTNQLFPCLEVVRIFGLYDRGTISINKPVDRESSHVGLTHQLSFQLLQLGILFLCAAVVVIGHDCDEIR